MARLFFGMNVSLDGYVDHQALGPPDPALFRHFVDETRSLAGSLYGRGLYQIMRYWDDDQDDWTEIERDFAAAWRDTPKWVVSRSLTQADLGPNATLLTGDLAAAVRALKADHPGEIETGGPQLAHALGALSLIDEYRLHVHPVVLGGGAPFFAGRVPPLRLVAHERVGSRRCG